MAAPWFKWQQIHTPVFGTGYVEDAGLELSGLVDSMGFTFSPSGADTGLVVGGYPYRFGNTFAIEDPGLIIGGSGSYISGHGRGASGAVAIGGYGFDFTQTRAIEDSGLLLSGETAFTLLFSPSGADGGLILSGSGSSLSRQLAMVVGGAIELAGTVSGSVLRTVMITPDGGLSVGGEGIDDSFVVGHHITIPTGGLRVGGTIVPTFKKILSQHSGPDGSQQYSEYQVGSAKDRGPTNQTEILIALRQMLINEGIFTESSVTIVIEPKQQEPDWAPIGDSHCEIRLAPKLTDMRMFDGGGASSFFRTETIEVRIYHRTSLDQLQRATIWTSDRIRGAFPKARDVENLFVDIDLRAGGVGPTIVARGGNGTILTAEPMRVVTVTAPQSVQRPVGWGFVSLLVEVKYLTDYDPELA